MDNILQFNKSENKLKPINIQELLVKIYNDRKVNNILHELIMNIDKILLHNGYQFKSEGDRDFTKDSIHKTLITFIKETIKEKYESR